MNNKSGPLRIFLALCVVGILVFAGAIYWAKTRMSDVPATIVASPVEPEALPDNPPIESIPEPEAAASLVPQTDTVAAPLPKPAAPAVPLRIFFRYTGLDAHYGKLAYVDGPTSDRKFAEAISCEVAYIAGGHGICLAAKRGVFTTYSGKMFDAATFATLAEFPLQGVPSRNRLSADGTLAAYTVFLTGHGYSSVDFTTQTIILEAPSAKVVADLEMDFVVTRDGQTIKEQDFNFWGVTFSPDSKLFYATLSTGGKHLLVRGDIAARTMEVIHENVECPSLSPDGKRIAYKKRFTIDGRLVWQLHVLDIATGKETALAEQRSIDDQLEWLDSAHVLYSVPEGDGNSGGGTDIWVASTDGKNKPRLYLSSAYSPSVAR